MKKFILSFILFATFLNAEPNPFDFPSPRSMPPKPLVVDSFYYLTAGAVLPASSMSVSHFLHPLPEITFGKRQMGLWHDWDYGLGARIGRNWEEFFVQSAYLFRPIARFGGYVGFGGRFGGFHDKYTRDDQIRHAYGYYAECLFHIGYEFFDTVPGFVQFQVSSSKNAVISYGFGF